MSRIQERQRASLFSGKAQGRLGLYNSMAIRFLSAILCLVAVVPGVVAFAAGTPGQTSDAEGKAAELPFQPEKNWIALTRDYEVWMDLTNKEALIGGRVCLRKGMLEMFACPRGTKEHESVVAVNTPARYVHAALVALGAKPGPPVQFEPVYRPAQGTKIEVTVIWKGQEGQRQQAAAQEWVKHVKTGKALQYPWVFAGSGFWTDEETGERFYFADGGEFICVSNFSTAMLDLPVRSTDANSTLMFSAFTEHIPPLGTPVFLKLAPQLQESESRDTAETTSVKEQAAAPAESTAGEAESDATNEPGKQPVKQQQGVGKEAGTNDDR